MIASNELLADASWSLVRDEVLDEGEKLQAGTGSEEDVQAAAVKLSILSRHPKWEVRKAVAYSVQYLPDTTVPAPLARLLQDENGWVQEEARKTLSRRTEMTHTDVLRDQHEDRLKGWLSELEQKHGPAARAAALRVGEKYTDLLIKEAYHELVKVITPLGATLINLQTAIEAKEINRASCRKRLARADDRLKLLFSMIRSLRNYTEEVVPEFRSESLHAMVEQSVAMIRDHLGPSQRPLVAILSIDPTIDFDAHRSRLLQVLGNVIHNAYESYDGLRRRRRVWISGRREDPTRVVLVVRDAGGGIPEDLLPRCGERFATTKPHGTGFGLALAKKIVETEHHGRLAIASEVGRGTTVSITLPIEQEKPS